MTNKQKNTDHFYGTGFNMEEHIVLSQTIEPLPDAEISFKRKSKGATAEDVSWKSLGWRKNNATLQPFSINSIVERSLAKIDRRAKQRAQTTEASVTKSTTKPTAKSTAKGFLKVPTLFHGQRNQDVKINRSSTINVARQTVGLPPVVEDKPKPFSTLEIARKTVGL